MLRGYRVLDITQFVAGPTATRILAELGADVTKVELAPEGDRSRVQGLRASGGGSKPHSTYFIQHNHSKNYLAVDFKTQEGLSIVRELIAQSDVLVENFAPGVMARAGLAYGEVKAINSRIVMCSISLAGQSGPLSGLPGYDYIGQAYAGITGQIGEPAGSPALITMAIGDVSTGVSAALAIVAALLHRERTGEGQYVEATLLDTYFHMHEANVPRVSLKGVAGEPGRTGSQHPEGGPTGIFRCGDGRYITLMSLAHQWPQLVRAMGMPGLLEDPRFRTASLRKRNNAELREILETWLERTGTREECLSALARERVPSAPVLSIAESLAHPHLYERGTARQAYDPSFGTFAIPGLPVRFSEWDLPKAPRAGRLGQDNETILRTLGYRDGEIADLYKAGVLVKDAASAEAVNDGGSQMGAESSTGAG